MILKYGAPLSEAVGPAGASVSAVKKSYFHKIFISRRERVWELLELVSSNHQQRCIYRLTFCFIRFRSALIAMITSELSEWWMVKRCIVINRKHFIKYWFFSIAPAQDNGKVGKVRSSQACCLLQNPSHRRRKKGRLKIFLGDPQVIAMSFINLLQVTAVIVVWDLIYWHFALQNYRIE